MFIKTSNPISVLCLTHKFGEFCQSLLAIAKDRHIHLHVLIDFRRINIHVDNLCLTSIRFKITSNTVIETHTYSNEYITFICLDIWTEITMHTKHTFIQWMVGWDSGKTEQRTSTWDIRFFKKTTKFFLCIT